MQKGLGVFKGNGGGGSYTAGAGIDITGNVISATGGDATALQTVKISISSAQILNSNTTPVELLAAAGVFGYTIVESIQVINNVGATPYATNTDYTIDFETLDGEIISSNLSLIDDIDYDVRLKRFQGNVKLNSNKIIFKTLIGNPTNGDGTLDIYISYYIIAL